MRRAIQGLTSFAVMATMGALATAGAEAAKAPLTASYSAASRSASTAVQLADASDTAKSAKPNAKAMASIKSSAAAGAAASLVKSAALTSAATKTVALSEAGEFAKLGATRGSGTASLVKPSALISAATKTEALSKSGQMARFGATRGSGTAGKLHGHSKLVAAHHTGTSEVIHFAALTPSGTVKAGSVTSAVTGSRKAAVRPHLRARAMHGSAAARFGASATRHQSGMVSAVNFKAIAGGSHKNFAGTHALKLATAVQPASPVVTPHHHVPPSVHHHYHQKY